MRAALAGRLLDRDLAALRGFTPEIGFRLEAGGKFLPRQHRH